jgi:hypothetical protein
MICKIRVSSSYGAGHARGGACTGLGSRCWCDALAVEFAVDELFQPEVNIGRLRAERGTARAVVFPMVAKGLREAGRGAAGVASPVGGAGWAWR